MIKLRTLIIAWLVIILALLWGIRSCASFDSKVSQKLSGGSVATKSMAIWELYEYKYTTLLRKAPMRYCPWKAYLAVSEYVTIDVKNNRYYLTIHKDIKKLLKDDAAFNKRFAKSFKTTGTRKQQIKKIFKYCSDTKYELHIKTAREVFTRRRGDCAGKAAAFYVLCKAKNIPVRYVIGWSSGCHAWNRVKVSGRWYWIDCTFRYWLCPDLWDGYRVMEMW